MKRNATTSRFRVETKSLSHLFFSLHTARTKYSNNNFQVENREIMSGKEKKVRSKWSQETRKEGATHTK